MITINFLLFSSDAAPESITASLNAVPAIHEMIQLAGRLYRVEDVTHQVESQEIHVRAVR